MSFVIKDKKLLKKYESIWNKISIMAKKLLNNQFKVKNVL